MTLHRDVTALMAKGGFAMRKWISSPPEVLATVPETERAVPDKRAGVREITSCSR